MPLRGLLLKACLACAATVCAGQAALAESALSMEEPSRGVYSLEGFFSVDASSATAWSVLTDYDGIAGFVSSMRRSRVLERRADGVLVEQEAYGRIFLFSRRVRVLLRVRERPLEEIAFEDISREDFDFYAGSWSIEGAGPSLRVLYRLEAKRRFAAPEFIARGMFRRNAQALLDQVRAEILRRR